MCRNPLNAAKLAQRIHAKPGDACPACGYHALYDGVCLVCGANIEEAHR